MLEDEALCFRKLLKVDIKSNQSLSLYTLFPISFSAIITIIFRSLSTHYPKTSLKTRTEHSRGSLVSSEINGKDIKFTEFKISSGKAHNTNGGGK